MELNKTDRGIIEQLRQNSRQSNRATGRALNVSEETVRRRTNAMVKAGVIHFGIGVSAEHLGFGVSAILTVEVVPGDLVGLSILKTASDAIHIEKANWTMDQRLSIRFAAQDLNAVYEQVSFIRESDGVADVSLDLFHNEGDWFI